MHSQAEPGNEREARALPEWLRGNVWNSKYDLISP
jgi:hypothetical protein